MTIEQHHAQIPTQQIQPPAPPTPQITPVAGSRLEQLLAQHDEARAAAKAAEERLKAITDGIKAELVAAAPNHARIVATSQYLAKPLVLRAEFQNRLDTTKLKADYPELAANYTKQVSFWKLEAQR